jgi:hypothetical protein
MAGRMAARMAVRRMARRRHRRRRRRRVILAGGLIAVGSYKLGKSDVDKIEAQTGKPAEELSDDELEQAIDACDISPQEMTDAEFNQVEAADEQDYLADLERLGKLHDQGVLTDEEFAAEKAKILDDQ